MLPILSEKITGTLYYFLVAYHFSNIVCKFLFLSGLLGTDLDVTALWDVCVWSNKTLPEASSCKLSVTCSITSLILFPYLYISSVK